MTTLTLTRNTSTEDGTFGTLPLPTGSVLRTAELPWRENAPFLSCIPKGTYTCVWRRSPKFGEVYHLERVPGRTGILVHAGNYAGDRRRGKRSDTDGCILVGQALGRLNEQAVVVRSQLALREFHLAMRKEPFTLVIR